MASVHDQNPARKVRSDSVLKSQPRKVQDAIMERIRAAGEESKYEAVRKWINGEFDFKVGSNRMLSEFRAWYELREEQEQDNREALDYQQVLEQINAEEGLGWDSDRIAELGNRKFMGLALKRKDIKAFTTVQDRYLAKRDGETRAALKRADLELKKQELERKLKETEMKVQKLERERERTAKTLSDPKLSAEQKQNRLKEVYGIA